MSFNPSALIEIQDFIGKNSKKPVKIVAISKNHTLDDVVLAINSGVKIFGENRVQEAQSKFLEIKKNYSDIELHLTGPLQTNKVKSAIELFDVFQTLDREKLAKEFAKFKESLDKKDFFIQINLGKEENKTGIYPEDASDFIKYCKNDLMLNVVGLMCIPPQNQKPQFFFNELMNIGKKNNIYNFSMGMSSDYKEGVCSGATHIRVGTKLFGERL